MNMSNNLTTSTKAKCSQASEALRVPPEKYFIDFWSLAGTEQNAELGTLRNSELKRNTEWIVGRLPDWVFGDEWTNNNCGQIRDLDQGEQGALLWINRCLAAVQINPRAMTMRWCDNRYRYRVGNLFTYATNLTATISTILWLIREGSLSREREREHCLATVFRVHSWHLSTLESQAKAIVSNHIVNKTEIVIDTQPTQLPAEPNAIWQSAAKHGSSFVSHILRQVVDNWNRSQPDRA